MTDDVENEIPNLTPRLNKKGIVLRFGEDVDIFKFSDTEMAGKIANVLLADFVIQEHDKTTGDLKPVSFDSLRKTLERVLSRDFGVDERLLCLKTESIESLPYQKEIPSNYVQRSITKFAREALESLNLEEDGVLIHDSFLTSNETRLKAFVELMSKHGKLIMSLKHTEVKHRTVYENGHYYVINEEVEQCPTLICSTNPDYKKGMIIVPGLFPKNDSIEG